MTELGLSGVEFGRQGDTLVCPGCGEEYLHHGRVVVYSREEDSSLVVRTTIDGTALEQFQVENSSDNPSSRRDGLTIAFWCEGCDKTHELTIAQHKGSSLVRWRETK
jgi:hypothetical protein